MSHFKNRLLLFYIQPFRWYILSCATAMFGNGLTYIAMTWLLIKGHHQVAAVAILMACFWLPNIVLGPFAGVIVDKYSRKVILLICNSSRMMMLICFWFLIGKTPPAWMIYILAAFTGTVLALYIPAAMKLVREIVPEHQLLNANATVDMAYELGAVIGMGSAGVIIALSSIHDTFLINALCFLIATFSMAKTQYKKIGDKDNLETFFRQFMAGFNYLKGQSTLLLMYTIQMLFFVSYMTAPILLAPYAKEILHANAGQFGMIEAAMSVGIVIGGIISPYLAEKYSMVKVIMLEAILGCIAFAFFSHNQALNPAIAWYFIVGFCFSAWPLIITAAQDMTQLEHQGRVQALFNSFSGILIMCFYLLLATVGEKFTIASLYWGEVILMIASLALLTFYFQKNNRVQSINPT